MIQYSNTAFLSVVEAAIKDDSGWRIAIYDHQDPTKLVASIDRWKSLSFNLPQSSNGVGAVDWNLDDAVFKEPLIDGASSTDLLVKPYYWCFYQDNILRFRMFRWGKSIKHEEDGSNEVTITGQSIGQHLEHAVVLPPPGKSDVVVPGTTTVFTNTTWADVMITQLTQAQARGVIPSFIHPTFTATLDSFGVPWRTPTNHELEVGTDLLKLLKDFSDTLDFSWRIDPDGSFWAGYNLGFDRSYGVRFFEGVDIENSEELEEAGKVRNDVYTEGPTGIVVRQTDGQSISDWRRRESYFKVGDNFGHETVVLVSLAQLELLKDTKKTRTFKVLMDPRDGDGRPVGRSAFFDYYVSDIIGYGPAEGNYDPTVGSAHSDFAIVEMAVKVDESQSQDLELTIYSRYEMEAERLAKRIDALLGGGATGGGGDSDVKFPKRQQTVITTGPIEAGQSYTGSAPFAPGYRLLHYEATRPCRFRLYSRAAKRDADLNRPLGIDPVGDHGLMFEFTTAYSLLGADMSPLVDCMDYDEYPTGEIAYTITNHEYAAFAITCTLTWLRQE